MKYPAHKDILKQTEKKYPGLTWRVWEQEYHTNIGNRRGENPIISIKLEGKDQNEEIKAKVYIYQYAHKPHSEKKKRGY